MSNVSPLALIFIGLLMSPLVMYEIGSRMDAAAQARRQRRSVDVFDDLKRR